MKVIPQKIFATQRQEGGTATYFMYGLLYSVPNVTTADRWSQAKTFLSDARQPKVVFFSFLDGGFAQIFGPIASIIVKTLENTNLIW